MPFWNRLGITLFNLTVFILFAGWGILALLMPEEQCSCGEEFPEDNSLTLLGVGIPLLIGMVALVAAISAFMARRWAEIVWRKSQLTLAWCCCLLGLCGVGLLVDAVQYPNSDRLAVVGLCIGLAIGGSLSAAQTRKYIQ